jgi:hypothetical protein
MDSTLASSRDAVTGHSHDFDAAAVDGLSGVAESPF